MLRATDSSGARLCECIKILRSKYFYGKLVDYVIVAVKTAYTDRKLKRHEIYKTIVVRIKKKTTRYIGSKIMYEDNAIVLYNKRNDLFSSRVKGPVCVELRIEKISRIMMLSGIIL